MYKEKYLEKTKVVVPELRGKSIKDAKKILEELNLNIMVDNTASKVTNMEPYPGSLVEAGANISVNLPGDKIDSNKLIMPDLKGKTLEEATNILNSLNISFRSNGVGIVD